MKTFSLTTVFAKLFVVIELSDKFSDKFKLRKRKRFLFSGVILFVAE